MLLPPRGTTEIHARANQVESFKQPLVKNRPSNPRGLCPVLVSTSADSWGIVGLSGHPEPQAHAGRGRCVGRGERRGAPPPLPHPSATSLLLACVPPSPRFSFPAVSLASTRSGLIQKPHIICWCHLFGWALLPLPSHCPLTARPLPVHCPFFALSMLNDRPARSGLEQHRDGVSPEHAKNGPCHRHRLGPC